MEYTEYLELEESNNKKFREQLLTNKQFITGMISKYKIMFKSQWFNNLSKELKKEHYKIYKFYTTKLHNF